MPNANKTEQARNSVEKANNAVGQAEDHPSGRMIEQADNSLASAEAAVRQAAEAGGESGALSGAADQVEAGLAVLDGSSS